MPRAKPVEVIQSEIREIEKRKAQVEKELVVAVRLLARSRTRIAEIDAATASLTRVLGQMESALPPNVRAEEV